jgi:hypothetical protein
METAENTLADASGYLVRVETKMTMTDPLPPNPYHLSPQDIIARCEQVMAHAWMVRTFIKHSEETEEFPELMNMARMVFDVSRALETRLDDPAGYLRMLRKKIGKLGRAADAFRIEAPEASGHMNFRQAVISMDACVAQLRELLASGEEALARRPALSEEKLSEEEE